MAPIDKSQKPRSSKEAESTHRPPAWADGLKRLYDDVVEEPLPDAFKDLLEQLDESDEGCGASS